MPRAKKDNQAQPLRVENLAAFSKEKYVQNGQQINVYYWIKNQPMIVELGLPEGNANVSFHNIMCEATLVYDTPERREVGLIRLRPLQYTGRASEDGKNFFLEATIKVLSSQHEDSRFRIQIRAYDSKTKAEYPSLMCYTEPIQVISKPEVLRPKTQRKKRTRNDIILEKLESLEEKQSKLQEITNSKIDALLSINPKLYSKVNSASGDIDLAEAFRNFVTALRNTPKRKRAKKLRQGMELMEGEETNFEKDIYDFMDIFELELGMMKRPNSPASSDAGEELYFLDDDFNVAMPRDGIPIESVAMKGICEGVPLH